MALPLAQTQLGVDAWDDHLGAADVVAKQLFGAVIGDPVEARETLCVCEVEDGEAPIVEHFQGLKLRVAHGLVLKVPGAHKRRLS